MKSRREWCELIGWTLAASLLAMQAHFVNAAEAPTGSAVSISRGETYIIKGASPDSRPEVKSIDNPNALIVSVQPDGSVMVLGADAGVEEVRVKMADGSVGVYTVTVTSSTDPANPLAGGGSAPPAIADGTRNPRRIVRRVRRCSARSRHGTGRHRILGCRFGGSFSLIVECAVSGAVAARASAYDAASGLSARHVDRIWRIRRGCSGSRQRCGPCRER